MSMICTFIRGQMSNTFFSIGGKCPLLSITLGGRCPCIPFFIGGQICLRGQMPSTRLTILTMVSIYAYLPM